MLISSEDHSAHVQNDIHQIGFEFRNITNLFYIIHKADITKTITALYQYTGSVLKIVISSSKHASTIAESIKHITTQYTANKYSLVK